MLIDLPFKTPTINHLYWHRGNIKIMKTEAKELRLEIDNIVASMHCEFNSDDKLKVNVLIYEDWFNLNGSVKKKDIQNREKFLIDSVFKSLSLDDKQIFECTFKKVQSDHDHCIVEINIL